VVQFTGGAAVAAPTQAAPREKALAGILITSILEDSPEVFIGRSSQGIYSIETPQGTIKFQIKDGNIQLIQGSIGLNDKIQRTFQDNIQALKD